MTRGLTNSHHANPVRIRLRYLRDRLDSGFKAHKRLGIAHLVTRVAAMQRLLIWVLEVKIGRERNKAVTRKALRQIARVTHEPVALVHDDDRGRPCVRRRRGDE